jgi:hypothetical protein
MMRVTFAEPASKRTTCRLRRLEKGEHQIITKGIKAFLIFLFLVSFPVALFAVPSGKIVTWDGGGKAK